MSRRLDELDHRLQHRVDLEKFRVLDIVWPGKAPGLKYSENSTTRATVSVPSGTQSINVLTTTGFTSFSVSGHASGFQWAALSQYASSKAVSVPWSTVPDDQADFVIVSGAGQSGFVYAGASPAPSPGIQGQSRGLAFPLQSLGVGVYTFDIPPQPGFKGIAVYMDVPVAAGTVQVGIFDISPSGSETSSHLNSAAIGVSSGSQLKVYPGIGAQANVAASDIISQSPRIKATVAAGACTFRIDYDLIP